MYDLEDNFDISRGDLIYGFDKGRELYIHNSPKIGAASLCGCWIIANNFNDNTILKFSQFYTPGAVSPTEKEQIEQIELALKQMGKSKEGSPFVKKLYERYPPSKVKSIDDQSLKRTGDSHNFKMIRRSCKFGIEYVTTFLGDDAKIHFVLDFMPDEKHIINKTKFEDRVPITTSELRFVFRNWDRFSDRIIFYKSLRQTFAPWESNPENWKKYAIERLKKYIKIAEKKKIDKTFYTNFDLDISELKLKPIKILIQYADTIKKLLPMD